MKLLHFLADDGVHLGVGEDSWVADITAADGSLASVDQLLEAPEDGMLHIRSLLKTAPRAQEACLRYAPCVLRPEKIVCVGLNYGGHAAEFAMERPVHPVLFSKFGNALAAHRQDIPVSPYARQLDYEAELVIVMGRECRDVTEDQALSYVFGYTAGNDLSERKAQFESGQWLAGKSWDYFAPVGPGIVPATDIDPHGLEIACRVNGEIRQKDNTRRMLFSCAAIVAYISRTITLRPGDLIFTGTPEGVMMGRPESEQRWLRPGDRVAVTIEGIGTLENRFVPFVRES